MKSKLIYSVFTFFFILGLHAQDKNKNVSFKVHGNCSMCKARIEKAAIKTKGVKFASWNASTKNFEMIFNENICTIDDVKKAIVKAGHDVDSLSAESEVYDKLPPCCKYRDPKSMEMDHH
ncbi:heavy-metal-associated domain-containing protein [Cellulophaga sp. L1A9]|uniref:heavy-metal-associated domain-containing protein n=1 Tax=Cellulophaga sp. L1A9 TaxID=2686362 RepID=UPI00131CE586|nr:heavy-metal-associated domain-containing protein [Cellulophaga sp. L1A9]